MNDEMTKLVGGKIVHADFEEVVIQMPDGTRYRLEAESDGYGWTGFRLTDIGNAGIIL